MMWLSPSLPPPYKVDPLEAPVAGEIGEARSARAASKAGPVSCYLLHGKATKIDRSIDRVCGMLTMVQERASTLQEANMVCVYACVCLEGLNHGNLCGTFGGIRFVMGLPTDRR